MTLLLCWLLAAPNHQLWVEREGEALRLSADFSAFFDADLRRRMRSGLTTTLFLDVQLAAFADGETRGAVRRLARARWALWDEQLEVVHEGPLGSRTRAYRSLDDFISAFARLSSAPIASAVHKDEALYQIRARLEVNPLSAEQMREMRKWLSSGAQPSRLDPFSSSLLGSFVRFFHNLKPGVAERVLRARGRPFRADRLPSWRGR